MAKPSGPFAIKSGVKQGCVLAPHSLEFSSRCCGLLPSNGLKMAFASIPEPMEIFSILHVSEFSLIQRLGEFSLGRYCSPLQHHTSCFANACTKFGLTIIRKESNIMAQIASSHQSISIGDYNLKVTEDLPNNLSLEGLDTVLNARIGKRRKQLWLTYYSWPTTQNESVWSQCAQHAALWQWSMDAEIPPRTSA